MVEVDNNDQFDLIIEPKRSSKNYWKDIWEYRELFMFLAWRDILVRYKQTVIGISWSIIRPFLTMIIFSVLFGQLAKLPSNGVPYPILVYSAMLPWQFFSTSFSDASNSLIGNSNLLTKIYFPRIIVPTSTVIVNFVDFLISFLILVGIMFWYHYIPSWKIFFLPLLFVWVILISVGAGLFVAAINVKYRDFKYIVPFVVQIGLLISPVGFSSDIIPEKWRILYSLNPMVGIIDGFRWSILDQSFQVYLPSIFISFGVTLFLVLFGISYFRKVEKAFVDII